MLKIKIYDCKSATDLVNELVILEKQYKKIAKELFKRVPSVYEEKALKKER